MTTDTSHFPPDLFAATRWSVVLAAGDSGLGSRRHQALAELCQAYWFPVYAYLRRKGYKKAEAEDLAQGFFAHLLEKKGYAAADPQRGRFRAFLITALQNFLHNAWDKEQAARRGGGLKPIELDTVAGEERFGLAAPDLPPEIAFDREWAQAVVRSALARLRQEYAAEGRELLFEQLQNGIINPGRQLSQSDLAERLGIAETAVKTALHRLRKHYRRCLREEIAQTTATPDEVDAEIRYLLDCLKREINSSPQ
jgi:RNA polymerase sigma-70 factor (ECF subfamily)